MSNGSNPVVAAAIEAVAASLAGHHPAALRSVHWQGGSADNTLAHLELETKHGRVVVFDHREPHLYANPPRPPEAHGRRHWRDLTDRVPRVFDNRPRILRLVLDTTEAGTARWRLELSTGVVLVFVPDRESPLLFTE